MKLEDICLFVSGSAQNTYYRQVCSKQHVTCLKKLVMVSVAGLKPVRLHDSSPLVVLSRERLPMMLEFLRSDHEPFLSARRQKKKQHHFKMFNSVHWQAFSFRRCYSRLKINPTLPSHLSVYKHFSHLPGHKKASTTVSIKDTMWGQRLDKDQRSNSK